MGWYRDVGRVRRDSSSKLDSINRSPKGFLGRMMSQTWNLEFLWQQGEHIREGRTRHKEACDEPHKEQGEALAEWMAIP